LVKAGEHGKGLQLFEAAGCPPRVTRTSCQKGISQWLVLTFGYDEKVSSSSSVAPLLDPADIGLSEVP
jgi:hypothetical protein